MESRRTPHHACLLSPARSPKGTPHWSKPPLFVNVSFLVHNSKHFGTAACHVNFPPLGHSHSVFILHAFFSSFTKSDTSCCASVESSGLSHLLLTPAGAGCYRNLLCARRMCNQPRDGGKLTMHGMNIDQWKCDLIINDHLFLHPLLRMILRCSPCCFFDGPKESSNLLPVAKANAMRYHYRPFSFPPFFFPPTACISFSQDDIPPRIYSYICRYCF